MAIEVAPLTEADIPGAIQVIQQAFADDPYFKWVFDESTFNAERNYASLAARCRWGAKNAIFEVARETKTHPDSSSPSPSSILGVSCWLAPHPPAEPESWYSWLQGWQLSVCQLWNNVYYMGRGGLRTKRYWIWKERQQQAQAQIWDDPRGYYFCNIVAVNPEAQGKGVGKRLFTSVTERADKEGIKCYLESSKNVPNVEIYQRMGFALSKEMECRDGDDACMVSSKVAMPPTISISYLYKPSLGIKALLLLF